MTQFGGLDRVFAGQIMRRLVISDFSSSSLTDLASGDLSGISHSSMTQKHWFLDKPYGAFRDMIDIISWRIFLRYLSWSNWWSILLSSGIAVKSHKLLFHSLRRNNNSSLSIGIKTEMSQLSILSPRARGMRMKHRISLDRFHLPAPLCCCLLFSPPFQGLSNVCCINFWLRS